MSEEAKVNYLFRGLKPTLVENIWVTIPKTAAEFFTALQLHTEASELAIRPDWAVSVLEQMKGLATPKQESSTELRDLVLELKAEITELKRASKSPMSEGGRENSGGLKILFRLRHGLRIENQFVISVARRGTSLVSVGQKRIGTVRGRELSKWKIGETISGVTDETKGETGGEKIGEMTTEKMTGRSIDEILETMTGRPTRTT